MYCREKISDVLSVRTQAFSPGQAPPQVGDALARGPSRDNSRRSQTSLRVQTSVQIVVDQPGRREVYQQLVDALEEAARWRARKRATSAVLMAESILLPGRKC